ncbi:MAG: ion channel [Stygiobacter sp.]
MLSPREKYLKEEEENQKNQLSEIIDKPDLSPEELWELYPKNYTEWCNKHYYPKLIDYFCKHHSQFKEWMTENGIDKNFLLKFGITNCISPKKLSKNKLLHVIEVEHKLFPSSFIGYKKLNKTEKVFDHIAKYKTIKSFISYSDWCYERKIKVNLLNIRSRTAPGHKFEQVFLDDNFELLKLGGLTLPIDGFRIIRRSKRLEFVNLCSLKVSGEFYFGEQESLRCSYSALDHLNCSNTKFSLPSFEFCSMTDISITDSKIQQWDFYDCNVDGEIRNTDLITIRVHGGNFRPLFKETHIQNFQANEIDKPSSKTMAVIYKSLKKIYSDQGEDKESVNYFIKEKEVERRFSKFWKKFSLYISYIYWGYGRKPSRVLSFSAAIVILFSLIYYFLPPELIRYQTNQQSLTYLDCLYTSFVSFTTLGFANIDIYGLSKIFVGLESFLGGISIGFIVAGFSNFKY